VKTADDGENPPPKRRGYPAHRQATLSPRRLGQLERMVDEIDAYLDCTPPDLVAARKLIEEAEALLRLWDGE
jgi:hypothetical protein